MRKPSLLVTAIGLLLLAGCASQTQIQTDNFDQIAHLQAGTFKRASKQINSIRLEALKETALSLGAQGGLAWRSEQIDAVLNSREPSLKHIYDFNAMLLKHAVLPPVLLEGHDTLNQDSETVLRLSDRSYTIDKQARFVTTPPTWRHYLWMDYPAPGVPDETLLPRNSAEADVWQHYVTLGWHNGVEQANTIFNTSLGRLNQDYQGMALYRKLLAHHMVSAPFVAKTALGITGGGNTLAINDQILRITALPQLQANSKQWRPLVIEKKHEH